MAATRPLNGALITQFSTAVWATATSAVATPTSFCAVREVGLGIGVERLQGLLRLQEVLALRQLGRWRGRASPPAEEQLKRTSTWPSLTLSPIGRGELHELTGHRRGDHGRRTGRDLRTDRLCSGRGPVGSQIGRSIACAVLAGSIRVARPMDNAPRATAESADLIMISRPSQYGGGATGAADVEGRGLRSRRHCGQLWQLASLPTDDRLPRPGP